MNRKQIIEISTALKVINTDKHEELSDRFSDQAQLSHNTSCSLISFKGCQKQMTQANMAS